MLKITFKPELQDLSVGARIAYIRRIRNLSQNDISNILGLNGIGKRKTINRYERGERYPKKERLLELSNILKVNYNLIKQYDYKNNKDLIYIFMWLEEIIPNYHLDLSEVTNLDDTNLIYLKKSLIEWNEVKKKKENGEILYNDYLEWKLNYNLEDLDNE